MLPANLADQNSTRLFGVLAFAWPGVTLLTLILFYGAFALVDGVLAIIAAITGGAPGPRWWLAIVGLLGIAAGLLTFLMPGLSAPLSTNARALSRLRRWRSSSRLRDTASTSGSTLAALRSSSSSGPARS